MESVENENKHQKKRKNEESNRVYKENKESLEKSKSGIEQGIERYKVANVMS